MRFTHLSQQQVKNHMMSTNMSKIGPWHVNWEEESQAQRLQAKALPDGLFDSVKLVDRHRYSNKTMDISLSMIIYDIYDG